MKLNVREFFTKSAPLQLALIAGAIVSGGCAPQVFKPRAYIPPPVVEPPQYNQYRRPTEQKTPTLPKFTPQTQPVITPIQPVPVVEAVEPDLPSLPPIQVKEITYKVKKGDSFWKIGRQYGLSMKEIAAYNNLPLKKHLRVGQTLILPPGAKFVPAEKRPVITTDKIETLRDILDGNNAETSAIRQAKPDDGKHFVMKGDSLWKIAKRYNLKTSTLANANNLSTKAMLKVGDVLIIPGKKAEVEAQKQAEEDAIRSVIDEPSTIIEETFKPSAESTPDVDILVNDDLSLDAISDEPITEDLEIEKIDLDEDSSESLFEDLPEGDDLLADESIDDLLGADDSLMNFDDQTESIVVSEDLDLNTFATRYGVKVDDLKKLNKNLPADGKLKKGTKVTIPLL